MMPAHPLLLRDAAYPAAGIGFGCISHRFAWEGAGSPGWQRLLPAWIARVPSQMDALLGSEDAGAF